MVSGYGIATKLIVNFGQDGTFAGNKTAGGNADDNGYGNFFYDVPAGFLALCSKNLPDPTVTPKEHFSVKLYDDGAGAKTGIGFAPELIWLKSRGSAKNHKLCDVIQGTGVAMQPNVGDTQITESTGLTAFGSDGFTVGADTDYSDTTGDGMVAWCWKLGGTPTADNSASAGATPTAGSVKIDGSNLGSALAGSIAVTRLTANTTAGISVGTWAGSGANATIAHGLSKAPNLVVIHSLTVADSWPVGSIQPVASMDHTDFLRRDSTAAMSSSGATLWNSLAPTASVINLGSSDATNKASNTWRFEAYHSVEGYSKIGAYNGNYNADGTFVYLGFRPAYVIIKRITLVNAWVIFDNKRNPYNDVTEFLFADATTATTTQNPMIDFLSNGMKMRRVDSWHNNTDAYLYMAFAETPFKNANAR
jgi:hypothetical protein